MNWKRFGCGVWIVVCVGGTFVFARLAFSVSESKKARVYQVVLPLAAGFDHTCAVFETAGLSCWGANGSGQLGDGTTEMRLTYASVLGMETGALALSAGKDSTCAVSPKGSLMCWGANKAGQLGNGTLFDAVRPTQVPGFETGVTAVSVGEEFACAIVSSQGTATRGVRCWGRNPDGRLGDGTSVDSPTPKPVLGLDVSVDAISAGHHHACVVVSGSVKCWGDNTHGQLGDGTTVTKRVPTQVVGLAAGVNAISAGGAHTCARVSSGIPGSTDPAQVWCWGKNARGQIGDGTTVMRPTPVLVGELVSGARAIAAGASHTCALIENDKSSSSVMCWGGNGMRQIGDDTDLDRLVPTKVQGISGVYNAITAGAYHTCIGKPNTRTACWGNNRSGQLGYNYRNEKAVPPNVD